MSARAGIAALAVLALAGCEKGKPAATASLRNPYAGEQKSATEGEKLFSSMNCDGCHGGGAVGFVGPSLSDGRWRYG